MPLQYYAFTIDKCTTKSDTSREELLDKTMDIMDKFYLSHNKKYKVHAFELKKPTIKYPLGRLHYHALLHSYSYSYKNKLVYTDVKIKGYSINIRLLCKPMDIAEWAGYIQKNKFDECEIILKKVQTFKKDIRKKEVIKVPTILDYYN